MLFAAQNRLTSRSNNPTVSRTGEAPGANGGSCMPSQLYENARASFEDGDSDRLTAFETWLGTVSAADFNGGKLLANIQKESHLVGEAELANPDELSAFLRRCAILHARAKSLTQQLKNYSAACSSHELRGLKIPRTHVPGILLRYSMSTELVTRIVERVLGKATRRAFDEGDVSPEDAFARLASAWVKTKMTDSEMLGRGGAVFATFEHAAGAPRGDATAMADALALRVRRTDDEPILFEYCYDTAATANHRSGLCT